MSLQHIHDPQMIIHCSGLRGMADNVRNRQAGVGSWRAGEISGVIEISGGLGLCRVIIHLFY